MKPGMAMMCSGHAAALGIATYFSAGQRGFWIDPSDLSTMFQDSAGTTPVTAAGQPVGKIMDKSGRGNHFTQATSGKRPTLQQDGDGKYYLDFVPANSQFLVDAGGTALAPGNDSILIVAGAGFDLYSTDPVIFARSVATGTIGRYWIQGTSAAQLGVYWSTGSNYSAVASHSATTKRVFTQVVNRVAGSLYSRVNGAAHASSSFTADAASNFSPSIKSRIGAYGNSGDTGETTNYLDGRVYGLIVRLTPTISSTDRDALESLMAGYLNP